VYEKKLTSSNVNAPVKSLPFKSSSNLGSFRFFLESLADDTVVPDPGPIAGFVLERI